jgi:O-methyltransferase
MNITEPEIAAANYFWDKIVSGGVIILDDYGFTAHINQKLAFDAWAAQKNVKLLSLPTGQAIIFKP